jgi:hypothetical protein
MVSRQLGAETVLTGALDRPALYGVLTVVEALGLDLVEVYQHVPKRTSLLADSRPP